MGSEEIANEVSKILSAKKQRNILIIILLLLIGGGVYFVNNYLGLKADLAISEQNKKALSDSLRQSKNKIGELTYSKNILVSTNTNLKDLSEDLNNELKKTKGKVRELEKIIAEFKPEIIYIVTELLAYPDGSYGLGWEYDTTYSVNNYRHLKGVSKFKLNKDGVIKPLYTVIENDVIGFTLTTGLREKDGNVEIFVNSPYPDLKILNLEGAIIEPNKHPALKKYTRKKKFSVGPYVGVGVGLNMIPRADVGLGLQFGVGLQYNLFQF